MRKSMSPSIRDENWTKHDYKLSYRMMRRGYTFETIAERTGIPQETIKAADYSYQAYGYEDNGWLSDERRKRFYQILWRVLSKSEGIPF